MLRALKNKFRKNSYFLVLGAGRGGTSLLMAMLDCHPKLEVGMELFAFDYLLGEKLMGSEKGKLSTRINHFHKACKTKARNSKYLFGNKITTEQILALAKCEPSAWPDYFVEFIETTVGKGKILFVVRDGRDCVNSKLTRTDQSYETALKRWKYSVQVLNQLQQMEVQLHVIKYEELISSPQKELEKAASFLGVKFHLDMLNGPSNANLPDIYKGQGLKQKEHAEYPSHWTEDMRPELKSLGYI